MNNAPWRLPNTPLQSTDIHQTWNRSPNFSQQCKETKGQLHKTSKKKKKLRVVSTVPVAGIDGITNLHVESPIGIDEKVARGLLD